MAATVVDQYQFTPEQDWFSHNVPAWSRLLDYASPAPRRVLEIGSWEGRSGAWMLQNLCSQGGSLVCIDHFDLMGTVAGRQRFDRINHNLRVAGGDFRVLPMFSFPALMTLLAEATTVPAEDAGFHWVYVDGSHEADDTLLDAELAWRLARKGAIFIFDDYLWTTEPNDSMHHPKRGIDSFLALHDGQYEKLYGPDSYQVVIKKTSDMRIGFLVEANTDLTLDTNRQLESSFGYSINVALTIDSSYAPAAAVAMCTAAEMTPGRISFYVVDCGLSADARDGLRRSLPERSNVTISFIDVAANGLTLTAGPIWAKVEMIGFLPVERVLYLDADVLVRADLAKLWRFDLGSKSVGAAVDVGFPAGHGEHAGPPYFNAGVLLIDLARVRRRLDDLLKTAESMRTARFADQDALNAHFGDDWTELPVAWNAQGLGTYATNIAPERERIRPALDDMCSSPHIVHFTGPVHPKLAAVLNPYVQPFTSKPWGYAGAPGHPFARGWWDALERTAWRGWKDSDEHRAQVTEGRKNAETEGMLTFAEVVDNALVEQ